jgi:hypothetical protein
VILTGQEIFETFDDLAFINGISFINKFIGNNENYNIVKVGKEEINTQGYRKSKNFCGHVWDSEGMTPWLIKPSEIDRLYVINDRCNDYTYGYAVAKQIV